MAPKYPSSIQSCAFVRYEIRMKTRRIHDSELVEDQGPGGGGGHFHSKVIGMLVVIFRV